MTRISTSHLLKSTFIMLSIAVLFSCVTMASADTADQPNVLYIMSDDHCAQAVGAYGGRLAKLNPTPVIDQLAKEGMLFDNCFCTNSICAPSRACVLTGQYNHTNGAYDLGDRVEPENQTLAIKMREAGYETAMVGKWHLKVLPNFDYYKVLPGQGNYIDPTFRDIDAGEWGKNSVQMKGHSSDCITDISLEWLKKRDKTKPFFLMHHYKAPHDMFTYAPRYEDYLEEIDIPEPKSLWTQPNFGSIATRGHEDECWPYIGTSIGLRHYKRNYARSWAKEATNDVDAKRIAYNVYMKKYLRCVKGVDDNLGRLFAHLRETGELDNTVIIYTGDQGFMLGEHDYMDKRWMYDDSQRMPFIVRYPKSIEAGSRTDAIIENVDFAPTMLEMAGIEVPESMQGQSFKSLLETGVEADDWKNVAYYRYWMHMAHHWNPGCVGVRTKEYKIIYYYGCSYTGTNQTPPGWELYDLTKDPTEVNNVYDDPTYADIAKEMKALLAKRRAEIGDTGEDYPECEAIVQEFWDYDEADRAKAIQISHEYKERCESGSRDTRGPVKVPNVKYTNDGFIEPADSKAPLRELDGMKEISRDAVYKVSHPGQTGFNPDLPYLLSGDGPKIKGQSFHSAIDAQSPNIVIRLAEPRAIGCVQIINRTTGCQERAEGLTLSISSDGKTWQQVWQAEKVEQAWKVTLDEAAKAQYLKLALPGRGTLHLNKVTVFGE